MPRLLRGLGLVGACGVPAFPATTLARPRTCADPRCGGWALPSLPAASGAGRVLAKSTGSGRSPMNLRMTLHTARAACRRGDRGLLGPWQPGQDLPLLLL